MRSAGNGAVLGQQGADPGLAGAADFVAGQHKAGRGVGRIGRALVADGGADVGAHGGTGALVQATGRDGDIAAHGEVGVKHQGADESGLRATQRIGPQQGVDGIGKQVLRLPANGVEGQRHTQGSAVGLQAGTVVGADGGEVVGLHRQIAIDAQVTVAGGCARLAEHQVGGDQTVQGQRTGARGGAASGGRQRLGLARQGGLDGGRFERQHQKVFAGLASDAVHLGQHLAAHIVAHHLAADGSGTAAAGDQADVGQNRGIVLGGDLQAATGGQDHPVGRVQGRGHAGTHARAQQIARQHHAGGHAGAAGGGLIGDGGADVFFGLRVDRQIALRAQVGAADGGQNLRGLLLADAAAQQGIDGVEQDVLRRPANGVEGQGHTHGGASGIGLGVVGGVDLGGIAGHCGQVTARVDIAVEDGHAHIRQHQVGGDQALEGHRGFASRGGRCSSSRRRSLRCGTCGQRLVGQQGLYAGRAARQQRHVSSGVQARAIDQHLYGAAHVVTHELGAQGRSALAAGRGANARHDARGVAGLGQDIGAHREHGAQRQFRGAGGAARCQQHIRSGVDQVARQHQAHRSAARRADAVFDGGVDLRHGHGRELKVRAHIESGVADLGTCQRRLGAPNGVSAEQRIHCGEEQVLGLPAHGIEGQHHAHSGAAAFGGGGVFGVDGGAVLRFHAQVGANLGHAVAQCRACFDQDQITGNQAVRGHGGAARAAWL